MSQLRLAYSNSNPTSPDSKPRSTKFRMSRANLSKLPRLASKVIQLQMHDPAAAVVIERLVDSALAEARPTQGPTVQGLLLE